MIALENVEHSTFAPFEGRDFKITAESPILLRLSSAKKLGHRRANADRDPFSLTFRGPQGLRLPQRIYHFTCEGFGEIELFITQVADGPQGSEFEAVFT
ncbi:hypothetical protein BH11VER1_BH11VER1_16620 [soil metagenome]